MKPDPSTHKRSFLKGLSWETFSLVVTFIIAWVIFNQVIICITFTFINFIIKLLLFYVHERVWHQIKYGKLNE